MKYAASLVVCLFAACAASDAAPPASEPLAPVAAPRSASPAVTGDWRARVAADVASLRADNPALYTTLAEMAPARTRAGLLRFTTRIDADPRATAVFLDRLARGGASVAERAALVEVLPRTTGAYADALGELFAAEQAGEVRAAYVFVTWRAPAEHALPVIEKALADTSPEVQAEAARAAAAHPAGGQLAAALEAALSAADPATRAEAARALGIHAVAAARAPLTARLADADADVRLASLRALDRIAPGSVPSVVPAATLRALAADADPRIARLAGRIAGTAAR